VETTSGDAGVWRAWHWRKGVKLLIKKQDEGGMWLGAKSDLFIPPFWEFDLSWISTLLL